jgi:hypothetical protein
MRDVVSAERLRFTSAARPPKTLLACRKCKTTDNTKSAGAKSHPTRMVRVLQCCSRGWHTLFFLWVLRLREYLIPAIIPGVRLA